MKLMTLNTHSFMGDDFLGRASRFFKTLPEIAPDVLALQEVNQTADADLLSESDQEGFISCGGGRPLRQDNYAAQLAQSLWRAGIPYFWTWLPVKRGYGIYDEGLAFFSRMPILWASGFAVSRNRSYENWRTRMGLMIRIRGQKSVFCNLHMGWWQDAEDPFLDQWISLEQQLKKEKHDTIWLMGDFNNPAHVRKEGYDRMVLSGWYDCYRYARYRDGEETVRGTIDGWNDQSTERQGLRIDQIWCNKKPDPCLYQTVFDGREQPIVSDHFGVLVTL